MWLITVLWGFVSLYFVLVKVALRFYIHFLYSASLKESISISDIIILIPLFVLFFLVLSNLPFVVRVGDGHFLFWVREFSYRVLGHCWEGYGLARLLRGLVVSLNLVSN